MNEFIERTRHVLSDILAEKARPDCDQNRLRELKAELYILASGDTKEKGTK